MQKNSTEILIETMIELAKAGLVDYYVGLDIVGILRERLDAECEACGSVQMGYVGEHTVCSKCRQVRG